ncbi:hypothetical protein QU593_10315 [Rossellomorea marisflavi]|uniref:hypothetical protein n=1 Tax=Rossellomorea marisflavi TaxID=189381 RepID=UPI0025B2155D|nr:hypothetical protein [Rossellomorea marisflavi]WJV20799.1 hypothetical protein QU593_10315 [Rossellomorea marisflavi]
MSNIILPTSVADELEEALEQERSLSVLYAEVSSGTYEKVYSHFIDDMDSLMRVLIEGYEIKKTPQDYLREYYDEVRGQGDYGGITREAIKETLKILGIDIKGINS